MLGCDTNAHHFRWGSRESNQRGYALNEFLATTAVEVLNQGTQPTFSVGNKQTIIDVTFASKSIAKDIHDSFSDHKKIYFAINPVFHKLFNFP